MPMHDWTKVSAGTYHDFHNSWITHLKESLNASHLPEPYYALGEQRSGDFGPDVLVLRTNDEDATGGTDSDSVGSDLVATATTPPRVQIAQEAVEDIVFLLMKQRHISIRHTNDDRAIAIIEIVSPANRHSIETLNDFADKVVSSLRDGIHVMVIDPFAPGRHDPNGIHGFIWERMMAGTFEQPEDLPLTLVSYCSRRRIKAWVDPIKVGAKLTEMPLFLTPDHYVPAPLEESYQKAWAGVPKQWQRVILEETD
ncbi:MAG: DUF4058 family protein [Planctomycetaceae bacterium]